MSKQLIEVIQKMREAIHHNQSMGDFAIATETVTVYLDELEEVLQPKEQDQDFDPRNLAGTIDRYKKEQETNKSVELIDMNLFSLDQMAEILREKYKFSSSADAKCIYHLLEFYDNHKSPKEQPKQFEEALQEQINNLPFTKHLYDGQIAGFEIGARWAKVNLENGKLPLRHKSKLKQ